ncbi:MAG: hypothetical protein DMF61_13665 [Blastocatellia bacterium AA13]|nr:MAG: hypothetical protein DMF61_13665 [Blastocatellia bacterium AA13]
MVASEFESAETDRPNPKGSGLWGNNNFNIFWAGQTFDALGDSAALILIPLLVLETTGSVAKMGLVTALIGMGNLLSSLVSGVLVDRWDRRRVMVFCDIGRMVFYLLIPVAASLAGMNLWLICGIAMAAAYLTTFFFITYSTAVANIVDAEQITEANGRLQATVALAYIAGPMIAGFASKRLSAVNALSVVAVSYGISALLMFFVRLRRAVEAARVKESAGKESWLDNLLLGARYILRHRVLRPVALLFAVLTFVSAPTVNLAIFRLKNDLHQGDGAVGVVFGIASIGAIIAGAIASRLRKKKGFGFSFLGSTVLLSAAIIFLGLAPGAASMALYAMIFSFGNTVRNVNTMSLRQQLAPDHLLGRVSAAWWTMLTVLGPMGTALGTAVAGRVGVSPVFAVIGTVSIITALIGCFTLATSRRPEDEHVELRVEAVSAASRG